MKFKIASMILGLGMAAAAATAAPNAWQEKMSELSSALSAAIPYLYPTPEQDPKGLTEKIKAIYEITRKLDDGMNHSIRTPDADPALPYIAGLLRQDIERAYQGLNDGHIEYAKSAVRNSVAYCIACHTRSQGGVEFPLLKAFAEPLKRASWIERIEFMAASRQFDAVLEEVKKQLRKPTDPPINHLDLERASRMALSIAVRVKKDPKVAESVAQAVQKSKASSFAMKEGAKVWLQDISAWKKEGKKKLATDKEMMDAAKALIAHAQAPGAVVGAHSDVDYLRASVIVHDLIKTHPNSPLLAEALYMVGLSYDSLRDLGLWSLHEMYFLACIDKAPHSELGEKCYKNYESSVTLGYSGSSGVHIPASVKKHLESVKRQAQRAK